jgi:hypothetical protein
MVLAWALGCAEVVADLAAQTLVPRTIDDHGLAGLNARVSAAQLSANQFVGPIVGGVAVATIGPGALAVAAAAYGFAALTIPAGSLPGTDQENPAAEPAKCTGLGDALHYLRARRDLASLAAAVGVLNAVNEATMAVLPALALGAPLRWSEQSLGTYIGLGGIGGLAGAAIAPATVRRWGPRATVAVTLPTIGATPIAIAAAPTTITVTTCLVLAGAATPCAAVAIVTHRQRTTPVHLLGRVNAAFQTLGIGAATIGAVAAANLQRALTHRQTIALIAIAGLTALAALRPARALPERPPRPQT